jgi:malonyl-CoA decarboxylase
MSILQDLLPSLRQTNWRTSSLAKKLFGSGKLELPELCHLMMASDGEFSSLVLAERVFTAYESLDHDQRLDFFRFLNQELDLDTDALGPLVSAYAAEPSVDNLKALARAAEPARQELLRRLNMAPGGTLRLVRMREDLLALGRGQPQLLCADVDFRHLFASWFNRGFLSLKPVDWTTPAHILEKIIAYEAVHEIQSWNELRRRLEPADRFCFAFFHPAMEDEPLVFVEVALTADMPAGIEEILDRERKIMQPDETTCAVFYSISNCHRGLAGVTFGNFLIKQVATQLQQALPHLKRFATISPAPGFRPWLESRDDGAAGELLQSGEPDSSALLAEAAQYYLEAKTAEGLPLDPVARFHLRNGATLSRLNPAADLSDKGMQQSLGLMVNYVYDLARVEENHENYMKNHKVICSSRVRKLLPT